jgi:hypothetical protein
MLVFVGCDAKFLSTDLDRSWTALDAHLFTVLVAHAIPFIHGLVVSVEVVVTLVLVA